MGGGEVNLVKWLVSGSVVVSIFMVGCASEPVDPFSELGGRIHFPQSICYDELPRPVKGTFSIKSSDQTQSPPSAERSIVKNLAKAGLVQTAQNAEYVVDYAIFSAPEKNHSGSAGFHHEMRLKIETNGLQPKLLWRATGLLSRMESADISDSIPHLVSMLTRRFPDVENKMIYPPAGN